MSAMKIYLICQGLTADEIDILSKEFDSSQLGGVVAEGVNLTQELKKKFPFDLYESIEKLFEQVNPELICLAGMSEQQFELITSLLESGVRVMVNGPLILTGEQVKSLYSQAERSNTRFYLNFHDLFRGASSWLLDWANHLENSTKEHINISIILNNQISRFRNYMGPNRPHWCYDLPCGVFHQELEKSLNLILPIVGKVLNIDVRESCSGYLPQNISDKLVIEIEGSRLSAAIKLKICKLESRREIKLSSNENEIKIKEIEGVQFISDSSAGENKLFRWFLERSRNVRSNFKHCFTSLGHSDDAGELTFISDDVFRYRENSTNIERYLLVHKALIKISKQLCNIHLRSENCFHTDETEQNGKRVLITGASGQYGKRLSKYLNDKGYIVRAFIRKLSDYSYFQVSGMEYCYGDVADVKSLKKAFMEVDYVVHAAADTGGDLITGELSTVQGTNNIIELCDQFKIERLIYISSCNVYDIAHLNENGVIDENSLLEQFPEKRGGYTFTKLKADLLVQDAISTNRGNITCLRPGTYISEGGPFMTPIVGIRLSNNFFAVFGLGNLILPFVFIENLCSATELTLTSAKANGQTFNVLDGLSMSKKEYVGRILKKIHSKAQFIFFPYKLLYFFIFLQEILLDFLGKKPYLTRYRFESSQKEIRYKANKIEELLNWTPPISDDKAIERILSEQKSGNPPEK